MAKERKMSDPAIIEFQPDAVETEERRIAGKVRWALYLILGSFVLSLAWSIIFKVDRIVVADGKLITTTPTLLIQSFRTATIRSIEVQVGETVQRGQLLATLDATFTQADLSQLKKRKISLRCKIRRINAELENIPFSAKPEEGDEGRLQASFFRQRQKTFVTTKQTIEDQKTSLESKRKLNHLKGKGYKRQLTILRDVEGTTARVAKQNDEFRLKLLDSQKQKYQMSDEIDALKAEEQLINDELQQVNSEWQKFIEERREKLMEQEVLHREDLSKVEEEIHKATRLHDLVSLRAPEDGVVLDIAKLSIGSILKQADPFITIVPVNAEIEVEANVLSRDIGRVRVNDAVRIKVDAFPFQRHDTLKGIVRIISEDAFLNTSTPKMAEKDKLSPLHSVHYRTRILLKSHVLRNVPKGFRLLPGMKVRAEIKVGKRRVISYFLYPIIRALDESLREP